MSTRINGYLESTRTSRRRRRCDQECGAPIAAGQRYVRVAVPPGHDVLTGERWATLARHLACSTRTA